MHGLLIKIWMIFNIFILMIFDAIGEIEIRITKKVSLLNNLNLSNYSYKFTPAETTIAYISNHLSYNCQNDLNIYKKNALESSIIKIVIP